MAQIAPEIQAALAAAGLDWLPPELISAFADGWNESNDANVARQRMREAPEYDSFFPNNRNPNGTVKLNESQYESAMQSYRTTMAEAGLNPDLWDRDRYGELIGGNVSPDTFQQRVDAITVGVRQRSEDVRKYYANAYGIPVTDAEMIASVIDPGLGDALIAERIRVAEIGGAAGEKGFDLDRGLAERLEDVGLEYQQAEALFRDAGLQIDVLDRLSRRHRDPNDSFDLDDYLESAAFGTPQAVFNVRRLAASERASFTPREEFLQGMVDR